jgi:hypothetical protein
MSKWLSFLLECKSNNLCLIRVTNMTSLINFANDLTKLKINETHKFIVYDIKYLFVNIPVEEVPNVTKTVTQTKKHRTTINTPNIIPNKTALLQNQFIFLSNVHKKRQEWL